MFVQLTSPSAWSSLEVVKLVFSLATPLAVVILGVLVHRVTRQFEYAQWRDQKIIEKRLAIYDGLASDFNDLLCYFTYVGTWKDVNPLQVISSKRNIDRKIYLAQPLFSREFFEACNHYMELCFAAYQGWGSDAKLRTCFERRREFHPMWDSTWETHFAANPPEASQVRSGYQRVMRVFAKELGLLDAAPVISAGRVPHNVQ